MPHEAGRVIGQLAAPGLLRRLFGQLSTAKLDGAPSRTGEEGA
jgi:hypothetical protein